MGLKRRGKGRVPDSPGLAGPEEGRSAAGADGGRAVAVQGRSPESLERKRGDSGGWAQMPLRGDSGQERTGESGAFGLWPHPRGSSRISS